MATVSENVMAKINQAIPIVCTISKIKRNPIYSLIAGCSTTYSRAKNQLGGSIHRPKE
jgi:hypothetical protein